VGNASILMLLQVAQRTAVHRWPNCSGDRDHGQSGVAADPRPAGRSGRSDPASRARTRSANCWGPVGIRAAAAGRGSSRIALVRPARRAGKSTLGRMLAEDLGFPFVELSHEVEQFAGCSAGEIQALYGQTPTAATSGARWRSRSRSTSDAVDRDARRPRVGSGDLQPAAGPLHARSGCRPTPRTT
jgi:XRE family aerobic/anaerobic benzoate catabolism transcriptional regulator